MRTVNEVISDLGARIAVLRRARALRQGDLAVAAGVGRSTISEIENGSTTTEIGNYLRVLAALNVLEDMNLVGRLGAADLARGIGQRARRARLAPMGRGGQKRRKDDVINVDDYPELLSGAEIRIRFTLVVTVGADRLLQGRTLLELVD